MRLRSKLASMAFASALAVGGVTATSAGSASADGCLRTVGQVYPLNSPAASGWGGHIADFYQGYDQCAKQAYAEIHFWNTRVPGSAAGSNEIYIQNMVYYNGYWYNNNGDSYNTKDPWLSPGYPTWWNTGKVSIYSGGTEVFKAAFNFTFDGPDGTHYCYGESWWRYSNGTVPVYSFADCPY